MAILGKCSIRGKRNSPVEGGTLGVEREWSGMRLVLIPDSLAIRWSLDAEQDAKGEYKKPGE